jgi:uncharacterized RDD family membrane protein YckC
MSIKIETTQNVIIEREAAGVGLRMAAYIIDYVICILYFVTLYFTFVGLYSSWDNSVFITIFILSFLPYIFYDLLFEIFNNGQSLGKMIMGIKVVNLDGTKPSFGNYMLRWLFRPVDFYTSTLMGVPGLVAFIMVLSSKNSQRLGDYLAGTTVINLRAAEKDKEVSLSDLQFPENYIVTFPDVLEKLSDKDIQTIRYAINTAPHNEYTINRIANRVKGMTGYVSFDSDTLFLRKIVNDYTYLSIH